MTEQDFPSPSHFESPRLEVLSICLALSIPQCPSSAHSQCPPVVRGTSKLNKHCGDFKNPTPSFPPPILPPCPLTSTLLFSSALFFFFNWSIIALGCYFVFTVQEVKMYTMFPFLLNPPLASLHHPTPQSSQTWAELPVLYSSTLDKVSDDSLKDSGVERSRCQGKQTKCLH